MNDTESIPSFKWNQVGNPGCGCRFNHIHGSFDHTELNPICNDHRSYLEKHKGEWPYNTFVYHYHLPKAEDKHPAFVIQINGKWVDER